jgi:hypothetical protein
MTEKKANPYDPCTCMPCRELAADARNAERAFLIKILQAAGGHDAAIALIEESAK